MVHDRWFIVEESLTTRSKDTGDDFEIQIFEALSRFLPRRVAFRCMRYKYDMLIAN